MGATSEIDAHIPDREEDIKPQFHADVPSTKGPQQQPQPQQGKEKEYSIILHYWILNLFVILSFVDKENVDEDFNETNSEDNEEQKYGCNRIFHSLFETK